MKIAVSATGPSLDSGVDPRFGRCQYFVIADPETMEYEAVDNPNLSAPGGAGIATAQLVADRGVEAVLTGNVGPNAYEALMAAGIEVVTGVGGTVNEAVVGYKEGRFRASSQPTVGAHFGARGTGMGGGMGMGRGMGMGGGGRGMGGGGRGMGGGMAGGAWPASGQAAGPAGPMSQDVEDLKQSAREVRQQLEEIERRIGEMESKGR